VSTAALLDTLLEASVRATLIAACVGITLVAFRVKAAATRHAVWTGVLLVMFTLPLVSGWLPTVPLPAWMPDVDTRGWIAPSEETSAPETAGQSLTSARTESAPVTRTAPETVRAATSPTADATTPRSQMTTPVSSFTTQDWVLFAWVVVAGVLLLREVLGGWAAHRLVRRSATAASTTDPDVVVETEHVTTPLVVGLWTPRVLVPASFPRWGADMQRMVVLHERAHVGRRDPLVASVARVNRAVFWFHPLAWWLERHLARVAEHACDEVVVRQIDNPRLYAALLVDMARRLQRTGQRVAWQGIGIVSARRLEERIDQVMRGPVATPSRLNRLAISLVCASIIGLGVACGVQVTPLAEDPEVTKAIAESANRKVHYETAIALTLDGVAELERAVAANPDDLDATGQLLMFYRERGQKLMGWNEMVAARRPHLLRLIERHPDSLWTRWPFAQRLDPDGYAKASALWQVHVARPDVTAKTLGQAASFYEISEKPIAEKLLLRAYALDPSGPTPRIVDGIYYSAWLERLGVLYAKAIVGSDDETVFNVVKSVSAAEAKGPFAQHARRELEATTSVALLVSAGSYLTMNAKYAELDFNHRVLGQRYLQRALQLNPASKQAARALDWSKREQTHNEDYQRQRTRLGGSASAVDAAAFEKLPTDVKIDYASGLLWAPYGEAMTAYSKGDQAAVQTALTKFKARAEAMGRVTQDAGVAPESAARVMADVHLALGTYAMRQGDTAEAVRRLNQAAKVGAGVPPANDDRDESSIASFRALELTHELLKAGERESVAAYYDAVAKVVDEDSRKTYETSAKAIRAGKMPEAFQRYLARARS
jgi:beta-lactamase regulating signal transducer with metallopeptidase domain